MIPTAWRRGAARSRGLHHRRHHSRAASARRVVHPGGLQGEGASPPWTRLC